MSAMAVASNAIEKRSWVEKVEEAVLSQLGEVSSKKEVAVRFKDGRQKVKEWAMSHGLEPLAILPTEIWNQICSRFNLYRLEMTASGNALAKAPFLQTFKNKTVCVLSIIGAIVGGVFGMWQALDTPSVPLMYFKCVLLVLTGWVIIPMFALSIVPTFLFSILPMEVVAPLLWPKRCNSRGDLGQDIHVFYVPVDFEVDDDFRNMMEVVKEKKLRYRVASLPEAIKIGEKAESRYRNICPALYLEQDGFAVLLKQCGEFKKEKEAVELAQMLARGYFAHQN